MFFLFYLKHTAIQFG